MSNTATQPRRVPAYWMPMLLNIWRAKRGKPAAAMERRKVLPAMAEAALERGRREISWEFRRVGEETRSDEEAGGATYNMR